MSEMMPPPPAEGGGSAEQQIAAMTRALQEGQFGQQSGPLGGFVGKPQRTAPFAMPEGFEAWRPEDVEAELRRLPEEMLARLQQELVAVGLASSVSPGFIDDQTSKAFEELLGYSNQRNQHWRETLLELKANVDEQGRNDKLAQQAPALYRAPNYDALAPEFRSFFRDYLRRDPTDAEMALMGEKISQLHRGAFDQQVSAAQQVEDNIGAGRIVEGPPQRDPMAELQEWARERFAPEREVVEDVDERQQATGMTNMIGQSLGALVEGTGRPA